VLDDGGFVDFGFDDIGGALGQHPDRRLDLAVETLSDMPREAASTSC
jgi:hypothetical protein